MKTAEAKHVGSSIQSSRSIRGFLFQWLPVCMVINQGTIAPSSSQPEELSNGKRKTHKTSILISLQRIIVAWETFKVGFIARITYLAREKEPWYLVMGNKHPLAVCRLNAHDHFSPLLDLVITRYHDSTAKTQPSPALELSPSTPPHTKTLPGSRSWPSALANHPLWPGCSVLPDIEDS